MTKRWKRTPIWKNIYQSDERIKRLIVPPEHRGRGPPRPPRRRCVVSPIPDRVGASSEVHQGREHRHGPVHHEMLEKVGLLKMDFLGLNNLTIVANTIREVAKTRAKQLDLSSILSTMPRPLGCWERGERRESSSWKVRGCGAGCVS